MISTILTLLALGAATVSAECSRELLKSVASQYVSAQHSGTGFSLLASDVTYIENDEQLASWTASALNEPAAIDHSRSFHDTVNCGTLTEIIVTDPKRPVVLHTRLFVDAASAAAQPPMAKVTRVDSIVTRPGDWAFNATGYLYWNSIESWPAIPAEKQDSRGVIQAAGDAYFNRWNDTKVQIPLGTPCARLEGGAYTGRGNLSANTCDLGGFPSTIVVTNRRYLVDEEMGVMSIFLGFPGLDRSAPQRPAPDSHLFRVEDGKVRFIHTVSHCFQKGCGMNGTGIPP